MKKENEIQSKNYQDIWEQSRDNDLLFIIIAIIGFMYILVLALMPFIPKEIQKMYFYFLIGFPVLLALLSFIIMLLKCKNEVNYETPTEAPTTTTTLAP